MEIQNTKGFDIDTILNLLEDLHPEFSYSMKKDVIYASKNRAKIEISADLKTITIKEKLPFEMLLLMAIAAIVAVVLKGVFWGFVAVVIAGMVPYYLFYKKSYQILYTNVISCLTF